MKISADMTPWERVQAIFTPKGKRQDNPYTSKNNPYGDARMMSENEVGERLKVTDTEEENDGMICGIWPDSGRIVSLPMDSRRVRHTATFGNSGTGKSTAVVRPWMMQFGKYGHSMVVTDLKGELFRDMAPWLQEKCGYKVRILNLNNLAASNGWDIMKEIVDEVTVDRAVDLIMANTGGKEKGDQFFDNLDAALLSACIEYVLEACPEKDRHLGTAYRMLLRHTADQLRDAFHEQRRSNSSSRAAEMYTLASTGKNDAEMAQTGLGIRLRVFRQELVQKILGADEIRPLDLATEKTALFICMPPLGNTYEVVMALLVNTLLYDIIRYANAQKNGRCDVPVDFLLDEFLNIGEIPEFTRVLRTARSCDIGIHMFFQDVPGLASRYRDGEWESLLGCCDYTLFLGANDRTTCEYFEWLSGITSIRIDTIRRTRPLAPIEYSENSGYGQRPLILAQQFRRMPGDDMFVFVNGMNPVRLKKHSIFRYTEALDLHAVNTDSIVPDWRFFEKGDYAPGEEAVPLEMALARAMNQADNLVIRDSAEYGPTRTNLENKRKEREKKSLPENIEKKS